MKADQLALELNIESGTPFSASDYQKEALRTFKSNPMALTAEQASLLEAAIGLSGESGEVADLVKKHLFHGHGISSEKLREELGDVCWYLAVIAYVLKADLSDIMRENVNKLVRRYPNGFEVTKSVNRSI